MSSEDEDDNGIITNLVEKFTAIVITIAVVSAYFLLPLFLPLIIIYLVYRFIYGFIRSW